MFTAIKNLFVRRELLMVFSLSIIISFVVFGNSIFGDFVFDDVSVVQNRGDLKDPSNFFNLFASPYHHLTKIGLFRPITMASYAINHYVNSVILPVSSTSFQQAAGFHVVNIIIHALNSFLVFWLVNYLLKNRFLSYATFFLFLVHPIHTEAVTSIVGRAELLAFFWSLVTIYFFIKRDVLLSSISFLFALFSKETALMVLPIIFYVSFVGDSLAGVIWTRAKGVREAPDRVNWVLVKDKLILTIKRTVFFIFPLGVYSLLRYKALGNYFLGDITTTIVENPLRFLPFKERIFTAFKVLCLYLEKLVWPVHLSADYSYNTILPVSSFWDLTFIVGAGFFVILLWFLFSKRFNRTVLAFSSLAFLSPYLIISNLIKPVGTIMGERLIYFPSFGFILLFSYILFELSKKVSRKVIYVVLAGLILFLSVRTIVRNKDWHDAKTLFLATLEESSNSLIARMALAAVHIKDNEWSEAKKQLNIARSIYEENSRLQNFLGIIADHEGDLKLAEEKYKKSLELNPDAVNAQINLAELYSKQGRLEEAGYYFKKILDFYPVTEYVVRYAYTQIALNNPEEALNIVSKYLADDLNHPDISVLVGTAYFVKGDYKQAIFFLKQAQILGNRSPEMEEMLRISEQEL